MILHWLIVARTKWVINDKANNFQNLRTWAFFSRLKQFSDKSRENFLLATWQAIKLPLPMIMLTYSIKKSSFTSIKIEFLYYLSLDNHIFFLSVHISFASRDETPSVPPCGMPKFNPSTLWVAANGGWGCNSWEGSGIYFAYCIH